MTPNGWLAAFAVAVSIGQHTGVVSEPLGEIGTTRGVYWLGWPQFSELGWL